MQECSKCGSKNKNDANHCSHCGYNLNLALFCDNCDAEVSEGDQFCPSCGYEFTDRETIETVVSSRIDRQKNNMRLAAWLIWSVLSGIHTYSNSYSYGFFDVESFMLTILVNSTIFGIIVWLFFEFIDWLKKKN